MLKGLNIKKIIIVSFLIISVLSVTYNITDYLFFVNEKSEPIVIVHLEGSWTFDSSTFVLYSNNKLTMTYDDDRNTLDDMHSLDEKGGFSKTADRYVKKVRDKDRKKIDEILNSIKKDCLTHDMLSLDISGGHIIYCRLSDKVYCAVYHNVKYAHKLTGREPNYKVMELVYELLEYAPTIIKIDGYVRIRYGDGSNKDIWY